ncbi:MAG: DUF1697 domain-containing protein [Planctomycetales bacterium]|nr:DUF1697 domain-containing protein [Planctomycetales bacterium]
MRGINVGGKNSLPMKELVGVLESLGLDNVRTYIQSGNAVFSSKRRPSQKLHAQISQAISAVKGFEPRVIVLSEHDLEAAITSNPFPTDDGKALHFFFAAAVPRRPNLERIATLAAETEQFALLGKTFYLFAPQGIGRSRLAAAVESALGEPVTARNYNTVVKLAELIAEA